MTIDDPFHPGERRAQELAGERDIALMNGGMFADRIVAPAFRFLGQQRFIVLGRASAEHECEATVLFGAPGFLSAQDDGKVLTVALDPRRDRGTDPVLGAIAPGDRVGGLVIDLATRRRLRVNGRVRALADGRVALEVEESYPNCPKYIQRRAPEPVDAPPGAHGALVASGAALGDAQRAVITQADTLFVVTVNPRGSADASHRGGEPGFVRVAPDGTLTIPDYQGNSMFNTLGNLLAHPRAAAVVWDFERGRLLHLAGAASVSFDEHALETGGTGRSWSLRVERWREQAAAVPFRMRLVERSPFNPLPTR